ncbi:hypothetical protein [Rufibacter ruber]|uniref:hypothetical protein n=1 Tax=Rufibacter ruber TaxID=1783499 RepID=UPI00129087C1|nr:hypothetical protein [Rufibacter ruber]
MKRIIVLIIFGFITIKGFSQNISNVKAEESHLYVYDGNGRKVNDFYCTGRMFGFSSLIIGSVGDKNHVYVYNAEGRKLSDFYVTGTPVNVSGDQIISKSGNHVFVYNKEGRKINDYFE